MSGDGTLNWKAPLGEWIIYRFGHTTLGALIQPAQPEATGLECDKMNVEAVSFHLDHLINSLKENLGDLLGNGLNHLHFDSYEAGKPSWTPKMREEFKTRRGYDPIIYLASFANRKIEGKVNSEKFRSDFEETIKDLYRDVYFKTIAAKLKAAKLDFLAEPYGGPWRQDDVLPLVGTVMTEFWTNDGVYSPYELDPTVAALRKSGQNIIEAEAFTGQPADSRWSEYPAWLKPIGDAAFCAGVNKMVLHRFTHQPWDAKYKPGNVMGQWGTHFDRTQTWWEPGKAMVEYWQRCQALLQWGRFVPKSTEDFIVEENNEKIKLNYIHRTAASTDIYFVANTSRKAGSAICIFNIKGQTAAVWDPVTTEMKPLKVTVLPGGNSQVQLTFAEAQSYFVVFRENENNDKLPRKNPRGAGISDLKKIQTLDARWTVSFDTSWGGPAKPVLMPALKDWTNFADKGIKYYSGTAQYNTTFKRPALASTELYLDLGKVNHIARIYINDSDLGVVWTAPWRIKIPASLLKASNQLRVDVTNVWANRLIGDEQEPDDMEWLPNQYFYFSGRYLREFPDWFLNKTQRPSKGRYTFTTWNYFDKDSPLILSGLLGPVTIIAAGPQ